MNLEEIMKPYYDKKENIEKQYIERKSSPSHTQKKINHCFVSVIINTHNNLV